MSDTKFDIEELRIETLKLLEKSNLDELTPKLVRRKLEEKLKFEEFSLDAEEPKALIKGILDEFILRVQQELEKRGEQYDEDNEANGNEDDFESEPESDKKSKKRKLSSESEDNEEEDGDQSEKSQKSKSESTASKSTKDSLSQIQQKIKNLKNYVIKCGVRKVWNRELSGLSERQQVKYLQNLLKELGVEGRPTLEKCKKVSILRELGVTDIPKESESDDEEVAEDEDESDLSDLSDSEGDNKSQKSKKISKKVIESEDEDEGGKDNENSDDNDSSSAKKIEKSGKKVIESDDGKENGNENDDENQNDSSSAKKDEKSGSEDEGSQSSKQKSKVIKKPKIELTPIQEKIAKLKSFVYKCGVRKVWKWELADLSEREQVNKLLDILKELGVEGQPTIDKCLKIAQLRELEAEKNSVDVSNIIESDSNDETNAPRTRSSRSQSSTKVKDIKEQVEKLEETKPQKRNDFFSFLNDSDIDD